MAVLRKYRPDILGGGVNSNLNKVYEGFNKDTELANVNPVKALTSGKFKSSDIGKTVYLSNSAIASQEWRIADINHDSTIGTVDLFPKYFLYNNGADGIATHRFANSAVYYKDSFLRTTVLNSMLLNGFTTEIQNAMKVQAFPSNGETLYDKVKCPSLTEVGTGTETRAIVEGTIYPIFGSQQIQPNSLSIYNRHDGAGAGVYWTRSQDTMSNSNIFAVNYNGYNTFKGYSASGVYVIACIRF